MPKPTLLCLCDAPTVNTGFACVSRNLLKRWLPKCNRVDIYGINYFGWPHDLPYRIFPAGSQDWNSGDKLAQFLNILSAGDYTHVWILCDTHHISGPQSQFPEYLRMIADKKGVKVTFYYPVDSPLDPKSMDIVKAVDHAVTITDYGKNETIKACGLMPSVIPHGVDTSIYYPREDRMSLREKLFKGWVKEDDFLMVNVNRNERRKAPHHSLEILKHMLDKGVKAKLLMHMPRRAHMEGTDLEQVGEYLGLKCGEHWSHNDAQFQNGNGKVTDDGLNMLYNAADLCLSTTLGEGFGFSQVEAIAAGCPVASPDHTACNEIGTQAITLGQENFTLLKVSEQCVVNMQDLSRVRYPVDTRAAADRIFYLANESKPRQPITDGMKDWLDWNKISESFFNIITQ